MALSTTRSISSSEQVLLMLLSLFLCGFLAYSVYDAFIAAAASLLQRLLLVSPVLLVIAVHWLMMPESADGAFYHHNRGFSSWAVGLVLVLLCLAISYVPAFNFWSCVTVQAFIGWVFLM